MRLPLLPPAQLSAEQKPLYDDMKRGIEKSFKGFATVAADGALMGPWNPWLRYPAFGQPIWELTKALSMGATLPKTVREVAILVTRAHFRSAYELYAHVIVAEQRGLPDATLSTIVAGQRPPDLGQPEAVAYDVAASLVSGGVLPDLTWRQAVATFGAPGAAELVNLVGLYCLVSITLNGFDVPVPESA